MKRLFFVLGCVLGGTLIMQAQGDFRAGIHLGPTIGDTSDFSSFTFGVDVSYLFTIDDTFSAGVISGYSTYPGKDDFSNYSFIPLAASGRAAFSADWFGALDLGYAIATDDAGGDGGFYYQPKVGWSNGQFDVYAFYQGVSVDNASFDISGLGVGGAIKL